MDICIIGAGVVGLAVARQLAQKSESIYVVEKNAKFGQEISSRNSEVIHSGIYYPQRSLKAELCVEGNQLLYDYCREKQIKHAQCGKLIVAGDSDEKKVLVQLLENAKRNQIENIRILNREEIYELEPHTSASHALLVPGTGIVDSHTLMDELYKDAVKKEVDFVFKGEIIGLEKIKNGYHVQMTESDGSIYDFNCRIIINCAGLNAGRIAAMIGINDASYQIHYCKGEYFRIQAPKNKLINHLIYPVPHRNLEGLGIHTTLELDGGVKLGPNTRYIKNNSTDYSIDPASLDLFYMAAKRYLPFLNRSDLTEEMAGIRPKLQGKGEATRDFLITNEHERGLDNFVNLLGIESPGLTACLAIAKYVESIII